MQAGFTGIGWTDEAQLCGTFGVHDMGWATAATAFLRAREFLAQLLDAGLDIGLQVFRALVLGNGP